MWARVYNFTDTHTQTGLSQIQAQRVAASCVVRVCDVHQTRCYTSCTFE